MKLYGTLNGVSYEIFIENGEVEKVLVNPDTFSQRCYQRPPVQLGLTITDEIFEKAVLAVCGKQFTKWASLLRTLEKTDVVYWNKTVCIHDQHMSI